MVDTSFNLVKTGGANPFYVHPGGDMTRGMTGLSESLRNFDRTRRVSNEQERVQKRAQEAQEAGMAAIQSKDPDKIAETMVKYPEMSDVLKAAAGFQDQASLDNFLDTGFMVLDQFEASPEGTWSDPEQIEAYDRAWTARQDYLRSRGLPTDQTDDYRQQFIDDPEGAIDGLKNDLASLGGERYITRSQALKDAAPDDVDYEFARDYDTYNDLVAKGAINPEEMDYFGFLEKIEEIKSGNADMMTQLKMAEIMVSIEGMRQKQAGIDAEKAGELHKRLSIADELMADTSNVMNAIEKASGLVKQFPKRTTGAGGMALRNTPFASRAKELEGHLKTIRSSIVRETLRQMRMASPTGGALGQVSNFEVQLLERSIAALDADPGNEFLEANLETVRKHYQRWQDSIQAERSMTYEQQEDWANEKMKRHWDMYKDLKSISQLPVAQVGMSVRSLADVENEEAGGTYTPPATSSEAPKEDITDPGAFISADGKFLPVTMEELEKMSDVTMDTYFKAAGMTE